MKKTAEEYSGIRPVCAFVDYMPLSTCSLDTLLDAQKIPVDFDLLSIDIDSYDLAVWHSLNKYSPKIVVIEINTSYMPGLLVWHSNKIQGNSFSSTLNVATRKGYSLVCHTGNMIFVRSDLISDVGIEQIFLDHPELLFDFFI